MRILMIDDSPMQQKIAGIYLEKGEGHTLTHAVNGKEGLELAIRELPDLILLDLEMPVMDGFATLDALKKEGLTKEIPVIICTSADKFMEEDLLKKGAAAFVKKPHGFSNLKGIIKGIMGNSK